MRYVPIITALLIASLPQIASAQDVCREQRRACEMREQLGEKGEGNCRRYRACKREACAELRQACMFKGERGEKGEGNCARYRATCR